MAKGWLLSFLCFVSGECNDPPYISVLDVVVISAISSNQIPYIVHLPYELQSLIGVCSYSSSP